MRRRPAWMTRRFWLFSGLATLAAGVALYLFRVEIFEFCRELNWSQFERQVESMGAWGPLICIATMVLFTIVGLSTTLVTIVSTLIFGLWQGLGIAVAGLALGMGTVFLLSRYTLRSWVERKLGGRKVFRLISEGAEKEGWRIVLFMRLMPINPFWCLNIAFGLTRIRFPSYILASIIGIIPFQFVVAWTTHAAGNAAAGKMTDWRVVAALAIGALAFATITWLPRIYRWRKNRISADMTGEASSP